MNRLPRKMVPLFGLAVFLIDSAAGAQELKPPMDPSMAHERFIKIEPENNFHPARDGVSKPYRNATGRLCVQEKGKERCLGDPEIPKVRFREVADRKFWATVALDVAMAAYAIEGTQHCIHTGTCREVNPLLGQSRAQMYPVKLALSVGLANVGTYYWRKWDMEDRRLGYRSHWPGWWLAAVIPPVANFIDGTIAWRHKGRE